MGRANAEGSNVRRSPEGRCRLTHVAENAAVLVAFVIAGARVPARIAFAQQEPRPSFDVASVKPSDPDIGKTLVGTQRGGRFVATNASLKMLIGFAYDLRNDQISGGPNWLDSAKYDIEAKADSTTPIPPGPAGAPQMRLRAQSLLADRFKLVVHRETREEPVYELTVAKGGSKLKEVADRPGQQRGIRSARRGQLAGISAPLPSLMKVLSDELGRAVIDKTGLRGEFYDFTLSWAPSVSSDLAGLADAPATPSDPSGPSIFTAVQDQLGLKLESRKGPVEILVIDHAEKPDAN